MKEIYIDKLPISCKECVLRYVDEDNCIRCNLTKSVVSQYFSNNRSKDCPLKQLTNAQSTVGWLQENKQVSFLDNYMFFENNQLFTKDFIPNPLTVDTLLNTTFQLYSDSLKYVFTDWKGARESIKSGKKVSIDWVTQNIENAELCYSKPNNTFWILVGKHMWNLSDELYDSKEWKVWEN